jgi:hypothetical protein
MGKIAVYVATVVVPAIIVLALTMNATTPTEYQFVRILVWISGISIFIIVLWALYREGSSIFHIVLAAAVIAAVIVGVPNVLRWVDEREVAQRQIPRVRQAFSAADSIKSWPCFLGGKSNLNIDNIAMLQADWTAPHNTREITLLLNSISLTEPSRKSVQGKFEVACWEVVMRDKDTRSFKFDIASNRRHEIRIDDRTYVVALLEVEKLEIKDVSDPLEYKFGISEK